MIKEVEPPIEEQTAHADANCGAENAPLVRRERLIDRKCQDPPAIVSEAVTAGGLVATNRLWAALQRIIGCVALACALPVLAVACVLVKLTSAGPALFAQTRRGHGGRAFRVYKVRTMRRGAEQDTALGVGVGEPTVTPVGRLLRKLKIDELPQFWNVVNGTMLFVGPRPIPLALEDELSLHIPNFAERHRVEPGLSSFGQVTVTANGVGPALLKDWERRFEAERHYIRNKSVPYDLVVIALTCLYVLRALRPFRRRRNPVAIAAPSQANPLGDLSVTKVLGAPIANLDYAKVCEQIRDWIASKRSEYVAICPVHSVVEGWLQRSHREALAHAGINTADGMPIVWAQKLLGHPGASRVYGPTLMLRLLEHAQRHGWRVGLYGGEQETLDILMDRLRLRFPKLQIVCAISPPFRELGAQEDAIMVDRINERQPDLLFVGLGCPKQERWMYEHRGRVQAVQVGVGAAFSFHAGQLPQAPRLLQRCGLEWLFRLCCEPRRLFRRYATTNPVYVVLIAFQVMRRWILGANYQRRLSRGDL